VNVKGRKTIQHETTLTTTKAVTEFKNSSYRVEHPQRQHQSTDLAPPTLNSPSFLMK